MKTKLNRTFIIVNKDTKEKWVASSGKSSWKQTNHAKCAFANSGFDNRRDPLLVTEVQTLAKYESLKFNDQGVYEIVELKSDDSTTLDKIREIVKLTEDWCEDQEIGITPAHVCLSAMKDIRRILKGETL